MSARKYEHMKIVETTIKNVLYGSDFRGREEIRVIFGLPTRTTSTFEYACTFIKDNRADVQSLEKMMEYTGTSSFQELIGKKIRIVLHFHIKNKNGLWGEFRGFGHPTQNRFIAVFTPPCTEPLESNFIRVFGDETTEITMEQFKEFLL